MKVVLVLSIGFLLFSTPTFGELSVADVEKIQAIVKESDTMLREEIAASEKRMREYVSQEIRLVSQEIRVTNTTITQEIKIVNATIAEMDKRLSQIFMLVIALVAFIGVVIGVPQIIVAAQRKHQRTQDEKIEAQQKQIAAQQEQIEALRQEMETRRPERVVTP